MECWMKYHQQFIMTVQPVAFGVNLAFCELRVIHSFIHYMYVIVILLIYLLLCDEGVP